MSAQAAKAAGQAAKAADRGFLNRGAKRDPELYVGAPFSIGCFLLPSKLAPLCLTNSHLRVLIFVQILMAVMSGAFGLVGYYFGIAPTNLACGRTTS
jgi:hypothetical protein